MSAAYKFGDEELEKVTQLRNWYISPSCPVERENVNNDMCLLGSSCAKSTSSVRQKPIKRLSLLRLDEFCTVEGQVVCSYFSPEEDDVLIMYIWDGPLADDDLTTNFYYPTQDKLNFLDVQSDNRLSVLTAHCLDKEKLNLEICTTDWILDRRYSSPSKKSPIVASCNNLPKDWSVPLFIYDEHAVEAKSKNIKPGDCIRVHNVHVVCCRRHECPLPGCLRLVVHGGGQKFGRGIEKLGSKSLVKQFIYTRLNNTELSTKDLIEANKHDLLTNLQKGFDARPPYLKPRSKMTIPNELRNVLTVAELCNIPLAFTNEERKSDEWNLLFSSDIVVNPSVSPLNWYRCQTNKNDSKKHKVLARLVARVIGICPSDESSLKEALVLACSDCGVTIKANDLPDETIVAVIPFIVLKLRDRTGDIVLNVTFPHIIGLFSNILDSKTIKDLESMAWWLSLILPMPELNKCESTPRNLFLKCVRQLVGQWIDVVVSVSWLRPQTPEDAGEIENLQDIQNLRFELIDWDFLNQD